GSNPYAPAGQYPRGSANWYSQTGATPGAFPVPVTANGARPEPGVEPPAYVRGATPEPAVTPMPRLIAADASTELHYTVNPAPEAAVRAACKGLAAVTEVRQAGPYQLVVKVTAATPADARAAFAAVSAAPELKPYKVEFEANVGR